MKRSGSPQRRKPIRRRSNRAARRARERSVFAADYLEEFPTCEAQVRNVCTGTTSHVHEIVPRSKGGSNTDYGNVLAVCTACHAWIHEHPESARHGGLLA